MRIIRTLTLASLAAILVACATTSDPNAPRPAIEQEEDGMCDLNHDDNCRDIFRPDDDR